MPKTTVLLDCAYTRHGNAIEITADLGAGWAKKAKTFGYSEDSRLEFIGDYSIRIDVTMLPRPSGFWEELRTFPEGIDVAGGDQNIRYTLQRSLLTILVQLENENGKMNLELPWKFTESNKLAIHWVEDAVFRVGPLRLELQLLMVFNPPPRARPEDVRDWERRFFPGGLPSLGKKR